MSVAISEKMDAFKKLCLIHQEIFVDPKLDPELGCIVDPKLDPKLGRIEQIMIGYLTPQNLENPMMEELHALVVARHVFKRTAPFKLITEVERDLVNYGTIAKEKSADVDYLGGLNREERAYLTGLNILAGKGFPTSPLPFSYVEKPEKRLHLAGSGSTFDELRLGFLKMEWQQFNLFVSSSGMKNQEVFKELVSVEGIDINMRSSFDARTALHEAVHEQRLEAIARLVSHPQIDLSIKCDGETALALAKRLSNGGKNSQYSTIINLFPKFDYPQPPQALEITSKTLPLVPSQQNDLGKGSGDGCCVVM